MSIAARGSCCNFLRRGRSINTFKHAAQASSFQKIGFGNHRCQLVFEHAPEAPPGANTLVIQSPPAGPQLTPHAPLQHQRLEQFPMEPHLCQASARFRPQRVHIEHALPAFYRDFHSPATPVQSHDRLGESIVGASVVKTNTQPANQRLSAVGVPFLWPCRHFCRARLACSAFKR